MVSLRSIIFDLDGTLLDSSQGILSSLAVAFAVAGVQPTQVLEKSLVGPPLKEIVASLTYGLDDSTIAEIISSFKSHYDALGYKQTKPYSGIYKALNFLHLKGFDLHIATNKRAGPTHLLLDYLGLSGMFKSVYTPDSFTNSFRNKTELLAAQLNGESLSCALSLYVGDRHEDWYSAQANQIRFAWAQWAYSGTCLSFSDNSLVLHSPESLHALGNHWD